MQHRFANKSSTPKSSANAQTSAQRVTNFGSNAERIQHLNSQQNQVYSPPSAVPAFGGVNYYKQRNSDFVTRYAGHNFSPPDYYLEYGDKYCDRFTDEVTPKLSEEGKAWLEQARINLQVAIEEKREANPKHFDALEKDAAQFKAFAYDTHPRAYWDAGLGKLGLLDLVMIGLTPDVGDLVPWEGVSQVAVIAVRLGRQWIENSVEAIGGKETVDWLKDQNQHGLQVIAELVDNQFGGGTTKNLIGTAEELNMQTSKRVGGLYEGARQRGMEDIAKTERFLKMKPGTIDRAANTTREATQNTIDSFQNSLERIWPF